MFVIFVCKRSVWVKVKTWWVTRVAVERDEVGHTTLRLLYRDSNNSRITKFSAQSYPTQPLLPRGADNQWQQ